MMFFTSTILFLAVLASSSPLFDMRDTSNSICTIAFNDYTCGISEIGIETHQFKTFPNCFNLPYEMTSLYTSGCTINSRKVKAYAWPSCVGPYTEFIAGDQDDDGEDCKDVGFFNSVMVLQ